MTIEIFSVYSPGGSLLNHFSSVQNFLARISMKEQKKAQAGT